MYIVVIGGGKVGYHLARALLVAGNEVAVIESDVKKAGILFSMLGNMVLRGDGSEPSVLESSGISRADVLIATTGADEDSLAACQMAKQRFGVEKTISCINNPENEALSAFFSEVKRVEAQALQRNLERIQTAAEEPRNWTASAWWCERRYPQHFGRAVQVTADVQTTNTERKELVLRILSDDNTRHHANELACRIESVGIIDADSRVAPGDNGGSGQQGEVDLLPPSGEVV